MPACEDSQPPIDVVNGLLEERGEFSPFFNMKQLIKGLSPCFVLVGSTPRGKLGSKRPHCKGKAGEAKPFFTKFEQLSIAEGGVVLLLVDPIFSQHPLDQSLRVALRDHPNGPQCCMKAWDLAGTNHE
jgi:hypothetical protein